MPKTAAELAARLAGRAGLGGVSTVTALTGPGMDNELSTVRFTDGRRALLRRPRTPGADPAPRARFLARQQVGVPAVLATDEHGSVLVEWIDGVSLADRLTAADPRDPKLWQRVGAAFARVHAVEFPPELAGEIGPAELVLRPTDPVAALRTELHASLDRLSVPDPAGRLDKLITRWAPAVQADRPRLLHGDVTLDNLVVGPAAVVLIDWDFPRVGSRLSELAALDEHAYLNDLAGGLPAAFWDGYGEDLSGELLLLHRAVGCLGWLASDDWTSWAQDTGLTEAARARLLSWHGLLTAWVAELPALLAEVSP